MINLEEYTAVYRNGKTIKFGNIENENEFPTEQEAKKFEHMYNLFATEAIKELMHIITKYGVVNKNYGEKISEEELVSYARHYYLGGLTRPYPARCEITLNDVLDKTKRVYSLSKDIKILKEVGLI